MQALLGREAAAMHYKRRYRPCLQGSYSPIGEKQYSARRKKRKYLTGLACMIISLYARGEADIWRRGGRAVLLINCGKWGHYVDSLKVKANRFAFKNTFGEFSGGPVVRTPRFHCWAWVVSLIGETCLYIFYTCQWNIYAKFEETKYWFRNRIPGMEEPGGLPSTGSHRVGHDWSDLAAAWMGGEFGAAWIHVYIYMAELVWCVPETITMLLIGSFFCLFSC